MENNQIKDVKKELDIESLEMFKQITLETLYEFAKLKGRNDVADSATFILKFRESLSRESDRGSALMAAAYIDEKLAELLKKYLIKDKQKVIKDLFDFSGALGTFSSRANMAYGLGLIPENIYDDINVLRKIRNDFAHNSDFLTFESEPIKSHCHNFKSHLLKNVSAKKKFNRTMMTIITVVEPSLRIDVIECKKMDNHDLEKHKLYMDSFKKLIEDNGYNSDKIE